MPPVWKLVTFNPPKQQTLDKEGILHGIVFGDGAKHRQSAEPRRKPLCQVYLCNDPDGSDSRRLAPLFEQHGFKPIIRADRNQVRFYGVPPHWKSLPATNASPSYLRGFVAGWFAADGHVDPRAPVAVLASASRPSLDWLQRIAARAGLAVSTKIGSRRSQSTFGPSEWFSLGISASTLDHNFFLLPEKRARFRTAAFLKQWKVVSVTRTDETGAIYSLATESGHVVLEGNILVAANRCSSCR